MKRLTVCLLTLACLTILLSACGLSLMNHKESSSPQNVKQVQEQEVEKVVPKGVPVLMYHKIGDDKDNDAVIREDVFKEQMHFLKDHGYHPISLQALYDYVEKGIALPVKPVVLTFDDGYTDTYTIVYPLMKELGFEATVFINPGDIGQRLTWEQVKEMKDNGIVISNHGFQHIEMSALSKTQQIENIQKGQEALASHLGLKDNQWFCFPYGEMNENSQAAVQELGLKMALTMNSGWVHHGDNPYNLKRIWIGNAVDLKHFEERLTTEHYSDL